VQVADLGSLPCLVQNAPQCFLCKITFNSVETFPETWEIRSSSTAFWPVPFVPSHREVDSFTKKRLRCLSNCFSYKHRTLVTSQSQLLSLSDSSRSTQSVRLLRAAIVFDCGRSRPLVACWRSSSPICISSNRCSADQCGCGRLIVTTSRNAGKCGGRRVT